jgi:hypothetical protein
MGSNPGGEGEIFHTIPDQPTRPTQPCVQLEPGLFPEGQAARAWRWPPTPFSAKVINVYSYTSTPLFCAFMNLWNVIW